MKRRDIFKLFVTGYDISLHLTTRETEIFLNGKFIYLFADTNKKMIHVILKEAEDFTSQQVRTIYASTIEFNNEVYDYEDVDILSVLVGNAIEGEKKKYDKLRAGVKHDEKNPDEKKPREWGTMEVRYK